MLTGTEEKSKSGSTGRHGSTILVGISVKRCKLRFLTGGGLWELTGAAPAPKNGRVIARYKVRKTRNNDKKLF